MPTRISTGVISFSEVNESSRLSAAFTSPVCSATPTPRRATSTTPRGWKPVKVVTMFAMNVAMAVPVSWF
jgi:hypothetical protein